MILTDMNDYKLKCNAPSPTEKQERIKIDGDTRTNAINLTSFGQQTVHFTFELTEHLSLKDRIQKQKNLFGKYFKTLGISLGTLLTRYVSCIALE
jgi:hypothetical protein